MISLSFVEENYLKAIYHHTAVGEETVSTNAIADSLETRAASVTDMLKKLAAKGLINYQKYYGVSMTDAGRHAALDVIRKHRLWETFLVEKLNFSWDQVHEVAEQLEHIRSPLLIQRLDDLLNHPRFDPHGDPIPSEQGEVYQPKQVVLSQLTEGDQATVSSVNDSSPEFLRYLDKMNVAIGTKLEVIEKMPFDDSIELLLHHQDRIFISREASENLWVVIDER